MFTHPVTSKSMRSELIRGGVSLEHSGQSISSLEELELLEDEEELDELLDDELELLELDELGSSHSQHGLPAEFRFCIL
jgi:ribosome assembly protein YihI (activator of Der GTPase)